MRTRILHNGIQYMLCTDLGLTLFDTFNNNGGRMVSLLINGVHSGSHCSDDFGRAWRAYQCEN